MTEHLDDSAHCTGTGMRAQLRALSEEDRETCRRWRRGVGLFYGAVLLAFGGIAVAVSSHSSTTDVAMGTGSPSRVARATPAAGGTHVTPGR